MRWKKGWRKKGQEEKGGGSGRGLAGDGRDR